MNLTNSIVEKISIEVIKILVTRFGNFPEDGLNNRNAPFHEAFLKAFSEKLNGKVSDTPFFISLSSWLQGLNTTLGQTFFENVAHHISGGEKREYTSRKLGNLQMLSVQKNIILSIMTELSNSELKPNVLDENNKIFNVTGDKLVNSIDFSADIFLEDEDIITGIELKSVKPNSGEMRGEKQKILEAKAALGRKFPGKKIRFFISFPFDPTLDPRVDKVTSYNKKRFLASIINMHKYFDENETLVASEFWDYISGHVNTMEEVLEIINDISTTEFLERYRYLNDNQNRGKSQYIKMLREWNLFSEIELVENDLKIKKEITNNKSLMRAYNKTIFDTKGNYNYDRYYQLRELFSPPNS